MAHWPSWISVLPSLYRIFSPPSPFSFGHTCHISREVQDGDGIFCARERLHGKVGDEERNLVPVVSQEIFSQLQGLKPLKLPYGLNGPPAPEKAFQLSLSPSTQCFRTCSIPFGFL